MSIKFPIRRQCSGLGLVFRSVIMPDVSGLNVAMRNLNEWRACWLDTKLPRREAASARSIRHIAGIAASVGIRLVGGSKCVIVGRVIRRIRTVNSGPSTRRDTYPSANTRAVSFTRLFRLHLISSNCCAHCTWATFDVWQSRRILFLPFAVKSRNPESLRSSVLGEIINFPRKRGYPLHFSTSRGPVIKLPCDARSSFLKAAEASYYLPPRLPPPPSRTSRMLWRFTAPSIKATSIYSHRKSAVSPRKLVPFVPED